MINDIEHDTLIAIDLYFEDLISFLRSLNKEKLPSIEANELIEQAIEHRLNLYSTFFADKKEDENEDPMNDYDDSMDGDHASALASAGWGTDEDYGYFGNDD
jgi:hypothetical protein